MNSYKWHELKNKGFKSEFQSNGYANKTYKVTKPDIEDWPSDFELISFCDGGENHYGGRISKGYNDATVTVYID